MRSRPLAIHAALVGGGWFVIAFVALVGLLPASWWDGLPPAVQGAGLTVVAVAALPVLWPVYLAIGWYEAGLAERLARHDVGALRRARRALHVQAAAFAAAGVAAIVVAISFRSLQGAEHATLAWAPLVGIALGHGWTARRLAARCEVDREHPVDAQGRQHASR